MYTGRWGRGRGDHLDWRMELAPRYSCMMMGHDYAGTLYRAHPLFQPRDCTRMTRSTPRSRVPVLLARSVKTSSHPNSEQSICLLSMDPVTHEAARRSFPSATFRSSLFVLLFTGDFPERVRTYRGGIDARWNDGRLPLSHPAQRVNPQAVAGEVVS